MRQHMQVDINNTTGIVCESCGSNTFKETFFLRKVSRFVTQQSEDSIIPIPAFVCESCGAVCKDAMPKPIIKLLGLDKTSIEE